MSRDRSLVGALGASGLLAALLIAGACARSGEPPQPAPQPQPTPQPAADQIYVKLECGACHGDSRQGTENAPPLVGLSGRWDEARLAAFLKDPQGTQHMAYREEPYPLQMPSFGGVEEAELLQLARYLLEN